VDEETDDFIMESGISAREYTMCDKEFRSAGATNMKGYEKVSKRKNPLIILSLSFLLCSAFSVGKDAFR